MLVVYLTSHCSTDHWLRIWEEGRLVRLKYRETLSFLSLCCFVIYAYKKWTHCSVYEQWGGSRALARKDIGKGVGWVGTSKIPTNYFPWLTGPPPSPQIPQSLTPFLWENTLRTLVLTGFEKSLKIGKLWDILEKSLHFPQSQIYNFVAIQCFFHMQRLINSRGAVLTSLNSV